MTAPPDDLREALEPETLIARRREQRAAERARRQAAAAHKADLN